jgi:hypothetical protein
MMKSISQRPSADHIPVVYRYYISNILIINIQDMLVTINDYQTKVS